MLYLHLAMFVKASFAVILLQLAISIESVFSFTTNGLVRGWVTGIQGSIEKEIRASDIHRLQCKA